jgi:hypothetical protein
MLKIRVSANRAGDDEQPVPPQQEENIGTIDVELCSVWRAFVERFRKEGRGKVRIEVLDQTRIDVVVRGQIRFHDIPCDTDGSGWYRYTLYAANSDEQQFTDLVWDFTQIAENNPGMCTLELWERLTMTVG